jgi:hypothetical protein
LQPFFVDFNNDLGGTKPLLDTLSLQCLCGCGEEDTQEQVVMECQRYGEAIGELQRKMEKVDLSVRAVLSPLSFTPSYVLTTLPYISTVFIRVCLIPLLPLTFSCLISKFLNFETLSTTSSLSLLPNLSITFQ